jgi:hypothetical protein
LEELAAAEQGVGRVRGEPEPLVDSRTSRAFPVNVTYFTRLLR